ncbi:hypothetical protein GCM10020256_18220 [Streptomyces thermocoprophilus]
MRTRLLPLLIVLMAAVLLALGIPLAISRAAAEQQQVVIDRIDDTARFAALAQYVTETPGEDPDPRDERLETLRNELTSYYEVYGIRAGVFYRNDTPMAHAPRRLLPAVGGRGAGRVRRVAAQPAQPRPAAGVALAAGPARRRLARHP